MFAADRQRIHELKGKICEFQETHLAVKASPHIGHKLRCPFYTANNLSTPKLSVTQENQNIVMAVLYRQRSGALLNGRHVSQNHREQERYIAMYLMGKPFPTKKV